MNAVPPVVPLPMSSVPWGAIRSELLRALAASDNDGDDDRAYELSAWKTPLNGFLPAGQPLAMWAGVVIAQRALFLQGAALGFPLEGSAILEWVQATSVSLGRPPVITFGLVHGTHDERGARPNGRIGVRFEWPGSDVQPAAYERCGRVPSAVHRDVFAGGHSVPARAMPDAWREVEPNLLRLVTPDPSEAALLPRWGPGSQDDGAWCPPPMGSYERSLLEEMNLALDAAPTNGATKHPPMKVPEWKDPKATYTPPDVSFGHGKPPEPASSVVLAPVGATEPDTKVLAPGEEPEELEPAPGPPPPMDPSKIAPVASVSCRRCAAHFVCPGTDDRIAEEVRLGCRTCGADVGEVCVMRPGIDASARPAREWLHPTTPTHFVQPDTGPPPPYAPEHLTKVEEPRPPPKRTRKRKPKAEDGPITAGTSGEGALFTEPAPPASTPDPT